MSVVTDVAVVDMSDTHIDAVVAIEKDVHQQPWSRNMFVDELSRPESRSYAVAMIDGDVVGYAGLQYVDDEAHITTLAVRSQFRRRGIAKQLMQHCLNLCAARSITGVTLEVRVSNEAAINLYRQFGFAPGGVRRAYYSNPTEDALILWLHQIDLR